MIHKLRPSKKADCIRLLSSLGRYDKIREKTVSVSTTYHGPRVLSHNYRSHYRMDSSVVSRITEPMSHTDMMDRTGMSLTEKEPMDRPRTGYRFLM